jgi:hypothetical protein
MEGYPSTGSRMLHSYTQDHIPRSYPPQTKQNKTNRQTLPYGSTLEKPSQQVTNGKS